MALIHAQSVNLHAYLKMSSSGYITYPIQLLVMTITIYPLKMCSVPIPRKKDRLSAQQSKDGGRKFTLKHVKNANLMLMCDECCLWRLLYACVKLTNEERQKVQETLNTVSFTCGAPIADLDSDLQVYTRALHCFKPIEKQYYSAGYETICVYCASSENLDTSSDHLPQCNGCNGKQKVKK